MNLWQFVGEEVIVVLKEHRSASQISAQLCTAELAHKNSRKCTLDFTNESGNITG